MTKFFHIVQIKPVYNGIVQTHKVVSEEEFNNKAHAELFIKAYNDFQTDGEYVAVYVGCVNDETGELV